MLKCYEFGQVQPRQDQFKFVHLVFNFDSSVLKKCIVVQCLGREQKQKEAPENSLFSYLLALFPIATALAATENNKTGKKNKPTAEAAAASKSSLWKSHPQGEENRKALPVRKCRAVLFFRIDVR